MDLERRKHRLCLDARTVPVVYRVRVSCEGAVVAESTVTCRASEVTQTQRMLREAFRAEGYAEPVVEIWAA